uniref:Integrase catalytic domain-containing protein n=1 Tax=Cannabis sativa TaxID=3483 RepID=A0A803Q7W8_CANSA
MVNKMFTKQLGLTMEAYIDDMLVKSKDGANHVDHLRECFQILLAHSMKLNPTKSFSLSDAEKVPRPSNATTRGRSQPGSNRSISSDRTTRTIRDIQKLTGKIVALGRFISKLSHRSLPFYDLLRGNRKFDLDEKCKLALEALKKYLTSPDPFKASRETLLSHLSLSKCMQVRYCHIDKKTLAVPNAIQSRVMASFPLKRVLYKREVGGSSNVEGSEWELSAHPMENDRAIYKVRFSNYQQRPDSGFDPRDKAVKEMGPRDISRSDSRLIVHKSKEILKLRSENEAGSSSPPHSRGRYHLTLFENLVFVEEEIKLPLKLGRTRSKAWRRPILKYLKDDKLPQNPSGEKNAGHVRMQSKGYSWPDREDSSTHFRWRLRKVSKTCSSILSPVAGPFGLPQEIVADNGPQFINNKFRSFCERWKIKLIFSTPGYPQSNGQAESSNKVIINNIKKRLESAKGRWAQELLSAYFRANRVKRRQHFPRALQVVAASRERREPCRMQNYYSAVAKQYNKKVRPRNFLPGELVLRKVFQNTEEARAGKLSTNWEGRLEMISRRDTGA